MSMTRYILLVHVRPEGSLDVFDPYGITVDAIDDQSARDVAAAVALERGWECSAVSIVRRESLSRNP
jgi:hypothetical protein